jgi:hypothetical protein
MSGGRTLPVGSIYRFVRRFIQARDQYTLQNNTDSDEIRPANLLESYRNRCATDTPRSLAAFVNVSRR